MTSNNLQCAMDFHAEQKHITGQNDKINLLSANKVSV